MLAEDLTVVADYLRSRAVQSWTSVSGADAEVSPPTLAMRNRCPSAVMSQRCPMLGPPKIGTRNRALGAPALNVPPSVTSTLITSTPGATYSSSSPSRRQRG
jgi:hypothetical protein